MTDQCEVCCLCTAIFSRQYPSIKAQQTSDGRAHYAQKPVAAGFEAQYAIAGVLGEAPKALISLKLRVLGD